MALIAASVLGMGLPIEALSSPVVDLEPCCCAVHHSPAKSGAVPTSSCACHVCPASPYLLALVPLMDFQLSPPVDAHCWTNRDESAPGFCPEPATPPPRGLA